MTRLRGVALFTMFAVSLMSTVANDELQRLVQGGPRITEQPRRFRERADDIERSERIRGLLDRRQFAQCFLPQGLKELVLELTRALVGPEDFRFHLLQLRRDEALAADGRLFARVALRHVCQVRLRDLDEITEDGIEPDLERFDPCLGGLALLQLSNPGF